MKESHENNRRNLIQGRQITSSQQACEILWHWQELRALTPAERIRILVERCMLPPINDNRDLVEVVREEMSNG